MESLGKNEFMQTECQIQNTHDTKMQKIKDAEKYYVNSTDFLTKFAVQNN